MASSRDHQLVLNAPHGTQACFLESLVGAGWVIQLLLIVPIVVDAITVTKS